MPEEALGELVDRVVVLGQQLAGDVEARSRRARGARRRPRSRRASSPAVCRQSARASARRASSRHSGSVARSGAVERVGQPQRLAAGRAAVDGVQRVALDRRHAPAGDLGDQAAAGAAVRAAGAHLAGALTRPVTPSARRTQSAPSRSTTSCTATAVARRPAARRSQVEAAVVQRAGDAAVGHEAVLQRPAAVRAGGVDRRPAVRQAEDGDPPAADVDAAALEQRHVAGRADAHPARRATAALIAGLRERDEVQRRGLGVQLGELLGVHRRAALAPRVGVARRLGDREALEQRGLLLGVEHDRPGRPRCPTRSR